MQTNSIKTHRTIKNAKFVQSKSKAHQVDQVGPNTYTVTSGTSGTTYRVQISSDGKSGTCTCKWAQYRRAGDKRSACSHVVSVFRFIQDQGSRTVSAWANSQDAKRQHRPMVSIGDGVTLTTRKA